MDAAAIREDFPALRPSGKARPLIYLDNAATTQRPRQVLETITCFYSRFNANIHRSPHALGEAATALYEQAHTAVARFIGARGPKEIVFLRNATEALNLVAVSLCRPGPLAFRPADQVVITIMEHHSDFVPWQTLCRQADLRLKIIGLGDNGSLDLDELGAALRQRTRLVCCTHVSNVLGTINPVADIARMTHDAGGLLLVDAAQSVPCMPVSVRELDCDFLAFSGHKMLAPFGTGVLYGKEDLLAQMSPFLFGGDMIQTVTEEGATWNSLPWKFEAGTPDVAAGGGPGRGHRQEERTSTGRRRRLPGSHWDGRSSGARARASGAAGYRPGCGPWRANHGPARQRPRRAAAVSFSVDGADPFVVARLLDGEGICVRAGGHCAYPLAARLGVEGTVRASPYIYNTPDEIARFLEVLRDIVANRLA